MKEMRKIVIRKLLLTFILMCGLCIANATANELVLFKKIATPPVANPPAFYAREFVHDSILMVVGGWEDRGMKVNAHAGLILWDVSDPSAIQEQSRYHSTHIGAYAIDDGPIYMADLQWPYLYLPAENQLEIIDVSNPSRPVLVGTYPGIHGGIVCAQDKRALLASRFTREIVLVDIGNPAQPKKLSSVRLSANIVKRIIWDGWRYAYIHLIEGDRPWEGQATYISMLDVSNPSQIKLISSAERPDVLSLIRIRDTLFFIIAPDLFGNPRRIQAYDISRPASPIEIGDYSTSDSPSTLVRVGDYFIGVDGIQSELGVYKLDGFFLNQIDYDDSGKTFYDPVWNRKNLFVLHPYTHEIGIYEARYPSEIPFFEQLR